MGIQINGTTDTISASDGGLVVSGQQLTDVIGLSVTGVITATNFVGNVNSSGVSTFTNGPVLIGSASSTGTTSQRLQVTGGASFTGTGSSVGIGTTNPAEQLELYAGVERLMIGANSPSTYSRIAARNTTNSGYRGLQIDGSDLLINNNSSGNVIACIGGGNLGIGTNNPADGSKLHIQGGGGLLVRRSSGSSIARFGNTGSVTPNITIFGSSTVNEPYIGCDSDDLTLGTNNTERVRITSAGVIIAKKGAIAEIGTLTDAATITPDFAANCNFTVTLGGNRTLANPTNLTAGQSGSIFIVQDGSGNRTLSWGSYWDFSGGSAPTLTTSANAVDRVDYVVRSSTSIHAVFSGNYS